MRHRISDKRLNRDKDHRKALLRGLSTELLLRGKIETTLAKAKAVRPYVEKLVTKAKDDGRGRVLRLSKDITNVDALKRLFAEIAPKFSARRGGYTRIVKLARRLGDRAQTARIEFVSEGKNER